MAWLLLVIWNAAIPAVLMWLTLRTPSKPRKVWTEAKIRRAYAMGLFR
jgi:hypothetical protein